MLVLAPDDLQFALPGDAGGVWTISHDSMSNDGPDPTADRTIHIDRYTGNVLADVRYSDYSAYAKAMAWGIAFHEGDMGLWNLVLNTLFCLSMIFLPVSGLVMWWKRRPERAFRLAAPPAPQGMAVWWGAAALVVVLGAAFPGTEGLRVPGAFDGFELAVRAVLGQQITVAAARTLGQRLVERLGEPIETPWPGLNRLFPTAATLAAADGDTLGQLGIVRQRQAAIVALARAVDGGTLALHAGADVASTTAALCALPGIGDWTAQYIAMRVLRWPDAFPAGDVALHKAGVTFVLDRSGITGDDGPSHHGIWDLALTGIVPNMNVGAPRDGARLREILREAVAISDAPSMLRFPKGAVHSDIPAFESRDGIDVLYRGESADVLLVSIGAMAPLAVEAASQAYREGVGVTVIDPRWVKPLPASLVTMAQRYKSVVVIEDGIRHGGIASSLSEMFRDARLEVPVHSIGVPLEFIEHSKRAEILEDLGITAQQIAREIVEWSSTSEPMQFPEHGNVDQKQIR